MSAHTPGPWTSECSEGSWTIKSALGTVAFFSAYGQGQGHPKLIAEAKANAGLIAAAPDMKTALKTVDPLIKMLLKEMRNEGAADWGFVNDSLVAISSAIAKAEGK